MASTPHFIERAAVAYSPDLARPSNMSISAYLHMLMDQRLVARDIALEYIAGYEQARFGGAKNDFSPVTLPVQHHNHHHHPRSTLSQQQRHPHDASIISTSASSNPGNGGMTPHRAPGEELVEEDYIRFMKVLSLILQGLGWDQNAEDAYEEEIREQEREQQEREREYHEQEMFEREEKGQAQHRQHQHPSSLRYFDRRRRETTIGSSSMDRRSSFNQSRQDLLQGGLTRSLSGESYCIVDEAELRSSYPYPEGTSSMGGAPGRGGSFTRSSQTAKRMSRGGVGGGHSTRMSTRSLMTMRTASSTKS